MPSRGSTHDRVDGNLKTDLHGRGASPSLDFYFTAELIQCPDSACRKYELRAEYGTWIRAQSRSQRGQPHQEWRLVPASAARVFPEYVPAAVREDYEEACAIVELSPKAAATLARRALQGMIRDFWRITPGNLYNEIEQLKGQVQQEDWEAIDATRKVGNIGAHMQKDINVIVDVDEGEAAKLIGLIEILIDDWYVHRHDRQQHLASVVDIAEDKTEERAERIAAAQAEPTEPPEA